MEYYLFLNKIEIKEIMQTLLITALIIAGLYFFLHKEKQPETKPNLTHSQFTQTETHPTEDNQDLEPILDNLIKSIQQLNKQIK